MKQTTRAAHFVITSSLLVAAFACSHSQDDAQNKSFYVQPNEVSQDGCLNMQKFLDRVHNFPNGAVGRIYTTDVQVSGGGDARETFLTRLARGNFRFQEGAVADILGFDHAVQPNCHSVTLLNADNAGIDYNIIQSTSTSVTLDHNDDRGESSSPSLSLTHNRFKSQRWSLL